MFCDVEVDDSPSIMGENDEYKQHPKCRGRDNEEINRHEIPDVLVENVFQVGDGGLSRWGRNFSTVDFATLIPSFESSATILGEPQVGLAFHIRRIRPISSRGI